MSDIPEQQTDTPKAKFGEVIFHVIARLAGGRLQELSDDEIRWLRRMVDREQDMYPSQAWVVSWLIDSVSHVGDVSPSSLWVRSEQVSPADQHHRRVTHGPATPEEQKNLERWSSSPGRDGTWRNSILRFMVTNISGIDSAMSKNDIAEKFGRTRDSIHPRVLELEQGGFVARVHSAVTQGTEVLFYPTPKGVAWVADNPT